MKPPRRRPQRPSHRQRQAARRRLSRFTNRRPAPALTLPTEAQGVREAAEPVGVRAMKEIVSDSKGAAYDA